MVKFDELTESAKKSYKVTSIVRKTAMFIGWGLFVILYIVVFTGDYHKPVDFLFAPLLGAGFISGMIHGEFLYKKVVKKLGFVIGIFISLFLIWVFSCIGFIFLIADTVLFFMKKSLIYPFENRCFLETRKAQEEIAVEHYAEFIQAANNNDAMNKIHKLKELLEQGAITEEEFNQKKSELLNEI